MYQKEAIRETSLLLKRLSQLFCILVDRVQTFNVSTVLRKNVSHHLAIVYKGLHLTL